MVIAVLKCGCLWGGGVGSLKDHDLDLDAVSTEKTARTALEVQVKI